MAPENSEETTGTPLKQEEPKEQNFYEILEIPNTASKEDIKKAYKAKALEFHPDKNNDPDATAIIARINNAYSTLTDTTKRANYDEKLKQTSQPSNLSGSSTNSSGPRNNTTPNDTAGSLIVRNTNTPQPPPMANPANTNIPSPSPSINISSTESPIASPSNSFDTALKPKPNQNNQAEPEEDSESDKSQESKQTPEPEQSSESSLGAIIRKLFGSGSSRPWSEILGEILKKLTKSKKSNEDIEIKTKPEPKLIKDKKKREVPQIKDKFEQKQKEEPVLQIDDNPKEPVLQIEPRKEEPMLQEEPLPPEQVNTTTQNNTSLKNSKPKPSFRISQFAIKDIRSRLASSLKKLLLKPRVNKLKKSPSHPSTNISPVLTKTSSKPLEHFSHVFKELSATVPESNKAQSTNNSIKFSNNLAKSSSLKSLSAQFLNNPSTTTSTTNKNIRKLPSRKT